MMNTKKLDQVKEKLLVHADQRVKIRREAQKLHFKRDLLLSEQIALKEKIKLNKNVMNELRYGKLSEMPESDHKKHLKLWVSNGNHYLSLTCRETQSILFRNQIECSSLLEAVEKSIKKIDVDLESFEQQLTELTPAVQILT